jgi:hypothetical protein
MVHNWPAINWPAYGAALVYALIYTGLLVFAACRLFRRKALN